MRVGKSSLAPFDLRRARPYNRPVPADDAPPARIEEIDPAVHAEEAAALLRLCWPPPSIHYSADYLRWQFGFGGTHHPALGVGAFAGGTLLGFGATSPRRLRLGTDEEWLQVVSFVAIHPSQQGRGLASAVYQALAAALRRTGQSIITYAQPDTAGQRCLLRAYPRAGFELRPLGVYAAYGCLVREGRAPPAPPAQVEPDSAGFARVLAELAEVPPERPALLPVPDAAVLAHYARDPRQRRFLVARGPDGAPSGAAMAIEAELVTAAGLEKATTLDAVFLPRDRLETLAGTLAALCRGARAGRGPSGAVLAPNLWGIDEALLRSAGLRRTGGLFHGYFCTPRPAHPFLAAEGTNLEIV